MACIIEIYLYMIKVMNNGDDNFKHDEDKSYELLLGVKGFLDMDEDDLLKM